MKKVVRSRKGFTLLEIVIVVAIIVILAGAAAVGVVEKINRANQNAEQVRLHAAGGHYWRIVNGEVVELDPNTDDITGDDVKCGGAMDLEFDRVKYIQGTVPNNPPQTYNTGGSGGLNPGTGGSGGDNPGDNPGGGGTPELWNGHTEEWWNENDAKWEEKIQQLKDQGIPPENIHVTKDERGHITGVTWSNPTSGGGSSSSTGGGSGSGSGSGNGNGNGNGNSSTPSVGADSATKTLNAPSEYNLQASNQSFSGNGQPITKLTITISDGATFTNVSAYDNGGKYKMTKSDDNKTVTITFDSSLGWASPESTLKVGNIQWSGSQNVQITYGFEYA